MSKVFLHICCAPCAIYPIQQLRKEGHEIGGYFYNPNIHPFKEFQRRLDTLIDYTALLELPLMIDDVDNLSLFLAGALEGGKERCLFCYRIRLKKTFQKAREEGFDTVSTTLLYSKYQRHNEIGRIGTELSEWYGMLFLYRDFREGWQEGITESKKLNLYRQPYCGCIFSEKERYRKQ